MTDSHNYVDDVLGEKTVAGLFIIKACERFNADLKRKDIYFDEEEAERVVSFVETILCLWEGEWRGKPVVLAKWQKFVIQNIFAWKYTNTKRRKYRSVYLQIARKNGKTTFADIITAVHIFIDNDATPQVLVGANNEDQAKICTNSLAKIIECSPSLSQLIDKQIHIRKWGGRAHTIMSTVKNKDAIVMAMSRDPATKDGFNPSLGIIDEYHEAKDDKLLNVIESGQGMRTEPLLVVITTAGFNKDGVCYSKMRKSSIEVVQDVVQDDSLFAMVYELDESDDWKDSSLWEKTNPMLPYVETLMTYLESRKVKAMNEGGSKEVDFKTKNLNLWTDAAEVWISDEIIKDNNYGDVDLEGEDCYVGIDLAKSTDLNACTFYFPNLDKEVVKTMYWITSEKLEANTDRVDYRRWAEQEECNLIVHEGNIVEFDRIAHDVIEEMGKYNVKGFGYDARYFYTLAPYFRDAGYLENDILCAVGQGFGLSPAVMSIQESLMKGNMNLLNNHILRWNFRNVALAQGRMGDVYPDKAKSIDKIDGVVSLCIARMECLRRNSEDENYVDIMIL